MPPGAELLALQEAVAGRYAVERELGRGGMGVVFLARDLALDRLVAIKLLPLALAASPDRRGRFLREARTAARLSHPNIVPIHSVEESDGLVFFVMGYVAGETLGERIRRAGRLSAGELTQIVREVAWALAYAHRQGVVHRDVKPENILLERDGGRAVVTDFGIAHVSGDAPDTPAGQIIGTARAVSPEQAAGEPVDGRSDLYSLGVTAYLAATGEWPFDGDSAAAILAQHLTRAPRPVLGVRPDLPAPLAEAIERCLAKAPEDRFASGEELAAALGSTLPVLATTPAPVARATRELRELGTDLGGYGSVMLFVVFFNLGTRFYHPFGEVDIFLGLVNWGIGLAMVALTGVRKVTAFHALRDAIRRGYGFEDIRAALLGPDEEREPVSPAGKLAAAAGWLAAFAGSCVAWYWISTAGNHWQSLVQVIADLAVSFIPLSVGRWAAAKITAPTPEGPGFWSRLWAGRLGRWVLKVAGGREQRALPAVNEATEVALGRAADALFAALPAAEQRRLIEVPGLIRQLEGDVQAFRRQEVALTRALAEAAGRPDAVRDLETARRLGSARLATALSALDNLRIDLLRISAGQAAGPGLTEHLEAARRIGREVDARIEVDG
ncbi:MAG TPA: serine/threonine-protein kinase [Gemmatimonadales bacterium]|nr:serine/threonine-protein kinase [Gemmatimonadales bacterium]